jgi:hypothetical protein
VIDRGMVKREAIAPRAFHHFTKTALVAENHPDTNQFNRNVKKVGIDPHFSYANQLCGVAWARTHGTDRCHCSCAPSRYSKTGKRPNSNRRLSNLQIFSQAISKRAVAPSSNRFEKKVRRQRITGVTGSKIVDP